MSSELLTIPNKPTKGNQLSTVEARNKSYQLRFIASDILGGRQATCGCSPIGKGDDIRIVRQEREVMQLDGTKQVKDGYYFAGLQSCGSVWTCPFCALKITNHKSKVVADLLTPYLSNKEIYSTGFLTLTTRHNIKERAVDVKNRVLKAWRKVQQCRKYRKWAENIKLVGDVRSFEWKISKKTGYHPHLHIAFVAECKKWQLEQFSSGVIKLFVAAIGKEFALDYVQKFKPIWDAQGLANYISKWDVAKELTMHPNKVNGDPDSLTAFGVLDYIGKMQDSGNVVEVKKWKRIFKEYAGATKGAKQVTISRKLTDHYKNLIAPAEIQTVVELEKTDEQIVEQEQENTTVAISIAQPVFKQIAKHRIQAQVLNTFEKEGIIPVMEFLQEFGIFTIYDEYRNSIKIDPETG